MKDGNDECFRIHNYGGPEVLAYEEAPCPKVGENDVLIRVSAASVNPYDWKVRQGCVKRWIDYSLPLILGWDVSGVIESVGSGVINFDIGDEVFASAIQDTEVLSEIAALIDSGRVKPVVSTVLPLNEVKQAHALSESMHTRGKVIF